jgi:molybdopterin-containing oxidoreductase family iron-sulfur binding subunit
MVIDLNRCIGCHACTLACKSHNAIPKGIFWSRVLLREKGDYPNAWAHYQPMLCMHCRDPECVKVCPTGASYQREDGIVAIDQAKCIGCQNCVMACPYGARTKLLEVEPYYTGKGFTPYEKVALVRHEIGVVGKCDFCAERLEEGKEPACVQTCSAKARFFGDLEDRESDVARLVARRNTRRLLEDMGTNPSVYYIELTRR